MSNAVVDIIFLRENFILIFQYKFKEKRTKNKEEKNKEQEREQEEQGEQGDSELRNSNCELASSPHRLFQKLNQNGNQNE